MHFSLCAAVIFLASASWVIQVVFYTCVCSRVLFVNLLVSKVVERFATFCGIWGFIKVFTTASNLSQPCIRSLLGTQCRVLTSILMFVIHIWFFHVVSSLRVFPTHLFLVHACDMPCPFHHPSFDHPSICWPVQVMKLLIIQVAPVISFVLCPDIFLSSILFKHPSGYVLPLTCETKLHTHIK